MGNILLASLKIGIIPFIDLCSLRLLHMRIDMFFNSAIQN